MGRARGRQLKEEIVVRRMRAPKEPKVPVVYEESSEIKHVAERLIRLYPVQFGWVANFKIGFVIVRGLKLNLDKREPWGKFKKVPPLYRGLTGLDAVVELVEDGWNRLAAEQQEALVAHELCHGSMSERGALRIEKHDLEEFRFVVAQWGAWDEGIRRFGEQLDLFTSRGPTIRTPAVEQQTLDPVAKATKMLGDIVEKIVTDALDAPEPTPIRRTNGGQQPPAPLS